MKKLRERRDMEETQWLTDLSSILQYSAVAT
jgi:hypothetical protein